MNRFSFPEDRFSSDPWLNAKKGSDSPDLNASLPPFVLPSQKEKDKDTEKKDPIHSLEPSGVSAPLSANRDRYVDVLQRNARFPDREKDDKNEFDHMVREGMDVFPEPVTVNVSDASATYERRDVYSAVVTFKNTTPVFSASLSDRFSTEAVFDVYQDEVEHHLHSLMDAYRELLKQVSSSGDDVTLRFRNTWHLSKYWSRNNNTFSVAPSEYRSVSRIRVSNKHASDSSILSEEIHGLIESRMTILIHLYSAIARDVMLEKDSRSSQGEERVMES